MPGKFDPAVSIIANPRKTGFIEDFTGRDVGPFHGGVQVYQVFHFRLGQSIFEQF